MKSDINIHHIEKYQKDILKYIKKYLSELQRDHINISKSIFCYFGSWDETPGFLKIKDKIKSNKIKFFLCVIKNIIGIGFQSSYEIFFKKYDPLCKNVILSWGYKESFDRSGNFHDNYLKVNSKNSKKTLWLIIYMDNVLPENISDNIFIIFKKKKIFDFFYLIKKIVSNLIRYNFNLKKFLHYTSSSTNFGEILVNKFENFDNFENLKKIYIPYESQIFQNMFIDYVKKKSKSINVYGVIHDFEPITPNLFYNQYSPDYLILPGRNRKKYFTKYLSWPKKKVITSFSTRYSSKDISDTFKNKILLPSGIYDQRKILKSLSTLIEKKPFLSKQIKVRKHPKSTSQKRQSALANKINFLIQKYKTKHFQKTINKKFSIVAGITSLTILLLEKNYKVYHITMEPELQVYTKLFWPEIKVKSLSKNVFEYSIEKKGIFSFRKKNNLNQYFGLC